MRLFQREDTHTTKLIESGADIKSVSKRNAEFEYSGFEKLIQEASEYEDLVEWGKVNNVWRGFNEFGDGAFRNNCPLFALALFNAIKDSSPEEYWRLDAEKKILVITGEVQR